mgnify:CR=1 FL=1
MSTANSFPMRICSEHLQPMVSTSTTHCSCILLRWFCPSLLPQQLSLCEGATASVSLFSPLSPLLFDSRTGLSKMAIGNIPACAIASLALSTAFSRSDLIVMRQSPHPHVSKQLQIASTTHSTCPFCSAIYAPVAPARWS